MRLGYCQVDVRHGNRQENYAKIQGMLEGVQCDLMVLPEFFTTGYAFDSKADAWEQGERLDDSETLTFLQKMATKMGGCLTGTLPERQGELVYDTAVLVGPDGLLGQQRKIHLTDREKRFFAPGDSIGTFELNHGVKVGMMSCFDAWFPEYCMILKRQGAAIVCNSCCFGGSMTPKLLPVRALESQSFVVSCNRIGRELLDGQWEDYCGMSQMIAPDGTALVSSEREGEVRIQEVDMNQLQHPGFVDLLSRDMAAEHGRYELSLRSGKMTNESVYGNS